MREKNVQTTQPALTVVCAVVCDSLWWSVVVCGGLWYLVPPLWLPQNNAQICPALLKYLYWSDCGLQFTLGWSGGAMVLGKLPVPGRPANLDYSRARASALAVSAGGVVWTFFSLIYLFFLSPSLWETTQYRLKYCLKGPLNPTYQLLHPVYFFNSDPAPKKVVLRRQKESSDYFIPYRNEEVY